jgi:hypothetical protein
MCKAYNISTVTGDNYAGEYPKALVRTIGISYDMRDGRAPMITDGTNDPLGLHRPGWRIATGGSERDVLFRDSQRKLIEQAHAQYLDDLTNARKRNR